MRNCPPPRRFAKYISVLSRVDLGPDQRSKNMVFIRGRGDQRDDLLCVPCSVVAPFARGKHEPLWPHTAMKQLAGWHVIFRRGRGITATKDAYRMLLQKLSFPYSRSAHHHRQRYSIGFKNTALLPPASSVRNGPLPASINRRIMISTRCRIGLWLL